MVFYTRRYIFWKAKDRKPQLSRECDDPGEVTMDRSMTVQELYGEVHALITLHQKGLYNSRGYQERKNAIKEYVHRNKIDLRAELDPISFWLYRRYID